MNRPYSNRKIDKLGRVVLPVEIRRALDIYPEDSVCLFVEEDQIILKKINCACCFCGETKSLKQFRNHYVCRACLRELRMLPSEI